LIDKTEYERMWRVLDMTLSGHSLLRDRYRRRETALVLIVLTFSIAATAAAFLADERTVKIGPLHGRLTVWLGLLTTLIFFLTLFDLVIDWREKAWKHEQSADRLGNLKTLFRSVTVVGGMVDAGETDLATEYQQAMDLTARIPERQFLRIKAKHERKVALSKMISAHPGAPLTYLRCLAIYRGIRQPTRPPSADSEPLEKPPV
jgi:hypothetical protein